MQFNQSQLDDLEPTIIGEEAIKLLTIPQFIKRYVPGVQKETVGYWMQTGKIDFFRPGKERFVVLSQRSKNHKPQRHSARN